MKTHSDRGFDIRVRSGWASLSRDHERRIRTIAGRVRRCASQEGNLLYSLVTLGLHDERTSLLAERLLKWQWPDGGWNCYKNPSASNSSFMETLIPLRGLAAFARIVGGRSSKSATESKVLSAVERASINPTEVFLKRRLFKRRKDGSVMSADFVVLHYPRYCHYDVLFGLKVMVEAGFIAERRCRDALDLPESKRLPGGGFAAEKKYYRVTPRRTSGRSVVDWGPTGKKRMNEFVAADALYVLKQAGRFQPA